MKVTYYTINHPNLGLMPTLFQNRDEVIPDTADKMGLPEELLEAMIAATGAEIVEITVEIPEGLQLFKSTSEADEATAAPAEAISA